MSRYARKVVNSGESAWDGKVNDNDLNIFDRPWPAYFHNNTIANLETAFPAATHDYSLAFAEYEASGGDTVVLSDASAYRLFSNWTWMRVRITTYSTGPQTLATDDDLVIFNGSVAITFNLSASSATQKGRRVYVKHRGTAGTVTVTPDGSDTIDGAATLALAVDDGAVMVDDGSGDWVIIASQP